MRISLALPEDNERLREFLRANVRDRDLYFTAGGPIDKWRRGMFVERDGEIIAALLFVRVLNAQSWHADRPALVAREIVGDEYARVCQELQSHYHAVAFLSDEGYARHQQHERANRQQREQFKSEGLLAHA